MVRFDLNFGLIRFSPGLGCSVYIYATRNRYAPLNGGIFQTRYACFFCFFVFFWGVGPRFPPLMTVPIFLCMHWTWVSFCWNLLSLHSSFRHWSYMWHKFWNSLYFFGVVHVHKSVLPCSSVSMEVALFPLPRGKIHWCSNVHVYCLRFYVYVCVACVLLH